MIGRGLLALALLSNCGKEIIIVFILIKLICSLSLFGSDARAEAAFRRCFRRSSAPRTAAHPHLGSRPKMERVHLHLRQIQNPVTVFVTSRCDDSCFVISLFLSLSLSLLCSSVIASDFKSAGEWGRKGKGSPAWQNSVFFVVVFFTTVNCQIESENEISPVFIHFPCQKTSIRGIQFSLHGSHVGAYSGCYG